MNEDTCNMTQLNLQIRQL